MENQNTDNKIWVAISHTVNLGNYESIKIEVGQSQTIDENETIERQRKRLVAQLSKEVLEKGKLIKNDNRYGLQ